jgi:hypothetical protein
VPTSLLTAPGLRTIQFLLFVRWVPFYKSIDPAAQQNLQVNPISAPDSERRHVDPVRAPDLRARPMSYTRQSR